MDNGYLLKVIAHIRSDFKTKFGVPRQSGLVPELTADIVFEPEYSNPDALRGIEQFSHLWLIWQFSESVRKDGWSPVVRPPRLGGNKKVGVFATRSPFRPNALGLSCVRLDGVDRDAHGSPVLHVSGADLIDSTPIFDIKPYLPFADSVPDAVGGFADEKRGYLLKVDFDERLLGALPREKQAAAIGILAQDPRPSYQDDPNRVYGVEFAGFDIKFTVCGDTLTVTDVEKESE